MLPPRAKLLGNSKRLKQLIKEHGDVWVVHHTEAVPMQCFDGGMGVFISCLTAKHSRNVRLTDLDI
jgi:hypothetical protein